MHDVSALLYNYLNKYFILYSKIFVPYYNKIITQVDTTTANIVKIHKIIVNALLFLIIHGIVIG